MTSPLDEIRRLRLDGRLHDARRLGEEAVAAGCDDDSIVEALVDVYLDIEADCLRVGVTSYIDEIDRRVDQLLAMLPRNERRLGRHRAIKLAALPGYGDIKRFEEMSHHDGCEREAYTQVRRHLADNSVDPRFHETVALILYRYLRADYTRMGSMEARRLLADYLALTVPRPSRVHSLMLRMAVRVARCYRDFNFARFFSMWDPRTLRPEDVEAYRADGSRGPSLAVAAIARVIDSDRAGDLPELLQLIPASAEVKMAVVRDAFHSLTAAAVKAGDEASALEMLKLYAAHGSIHAASRSHSAMLSIALRLMRREQAAFFPEFFTRWDPYQALAADYMPSMGSGGERVPSLMSRAMTRCFMTVKADLPRYAYLLPDIIRAFDSAASAMPGGPDEMTDRRRAMLLAWNNCEDTAIDRFRAMAASRRELSPQFYADFADIVESRQLKKGLLALGLISNAGSGDAEGSAALRLSLAQLFHHDGHDDWASLELKLYVDEVASTAAEPSARYGAVASTISADAAPSISNDQIYHLLAADALDFIYSKLQARYMSVVAAGEGYLTVTDGMSQPLVVDTRRWRVAAGLEQGANVSVRLDASGIPVAVRPVEGPPYEALPLYRAVVVSTRPLMVHCAGKSDPIPVTSGGAAETGMTCTVAVYKDKDGARRGVNMRREPIASARRYFDHLPVAIYEMLPDGAAAYSAGPDLEPGLIPAGLAAGLGMYEPVEIYFYRTKDGGRSVISVSEAIDPDSCKAIKSVSGPLVMSDGGGSVRDVRVATELMEKAGIDDRTYVSVSAVYLPRRGSVTPLWQATEISAYRSRG